MSNLTSELNIDASRSTHTFPRSNRDHVIVINDFRHLLLIMNIYLEISV